VVWRGKQRNEALEQQIRTGQHSPGPFRVRGPLSNMPAFAQTMAARPATAWSPTTRCRFGDRRLISGPWPAPVHRWRPGQAPASRGSAGRFG
jgi:hypothetical protein